jgi:hypothetical protein
MFDVLGWTVVAVNMLLGLLTGSTFSFAVAAFLGATLFLSAQH